jgi:hypothetical protein
LAGIERELPRLKTMSTDIPWLYVAKRQFINGGAKATRWTSFSVSASVW